jgi:hypothetical protein
MSLALCVPLALLTPGAQSAEPGPPSPSRLAVKDAPAENGKASTVFDRLVALAETGNADAQYNLGMFYNNGIGTQRDTSSALEYFSKAAQAGHLLASYKLGCYYAGQFGAVVPQDKQAALSYKLRSAEAGYDLAQHDVGTHFAKNGDMEKASIWWEKASQQGYTPSTAYLADYLSGPGASDKARGLALLLVLKDQAPMMTEKLSQRLAGAQATLSEDDRLKAERIRAAWPNAPTPLSTLARAGMSAVPALLQLAERPELGAAR